jgi:hypothetical protein
MREVMLACTTVRGFLNLITWGRYWAQGHSECPHCSFLVCFQGCSVRTNNQASKENTCEGLIEARKEAQIGCCAVDDV